MYVTTKNFKKSSTITINLENGKQITINIDPKITKFDGRDIRLNEITIDCPKEINFEVKKEDKS